ncbi:hypothetical protein D1BOALGB6SA_562 [Olavius sp. associated proteobacterium Delta 1]|nr:hypothetical protein D1BOALGB6SA_562 [Olavius sp. associated proteobacterium Delta 1]
MIAKFHGVFSLLLILASVMIALAYLLSISTAWQKFYFLSAGPAVILTAPIVS